MSRVGSRFEGVCSWICVLVDMQGSDQPPAALPHGVVLCSPIALEYKLHIGKVATASVAIPTGVVHGICANELPHQVVWCAVSCCACCAVLLQVRWAWTCRLCATSS